MELIATKDFSNGPMLGLKLSEHKGADGKPQSHVKDRNGKELAHHIHKGARFSVGSLKELKDFSASSPDRAKIQWLLFTHSAEPATEGVVSRVQQEISDEQARLEADAKQTQAAKAPGIDEIVAAVVAAIASKGSKKAAEA